MNNESINSSQILLEIARGYSALAVKDKTFFFKHPSNLHYLENEEYYHQRYQQAIKRGISTEQQLLNSYIKRGVWSIEKEEKIKNLRWVIDKSLTASQKITDEIQKKIFLNSVEAQRKELDALESKRKQLVQQSAEAWAGQQRMFKMVKDHVFLDALFKKGVKITDDIPLIIALQNKMSELSDRRSLLAAAFESSFFDLFSIQYRDPLSIFNVDFFTISVFQRSLLNYASVLLHKLQNIEMPDNVRKDPVLIYEYNPSAKQKESRVTHGVEDLKQIVKNNGKVTAADLVT